MRKSFRATSAATAIRAVPAAPVTQISRRAFIIGIGGVTAVAAAALGKDLIPSLGPPATSKNLTTGCSAISMTTTAIVLDLSDEYSRVHIARAVKTVEDEARRIPEGGRIIIFSMNSDVPDDFANHIAKCSPGRAESSSWTQGEEYNRRKLENDFILPLREHTEKAIATASTAVSPIIETTAAITRDPLFDTTVQNRRLVWVTDGLQNDYLDVPVRRQKGKPDMSGRFTLYTNEDIEKLFRRSRLARQLHADLSNVPVNIAYLVRPDVQRFQTPTARAWLVRRFQEAGAKDVRFTGIPAEMVSR